MTQCQFALVSSRTVRQYLVGLYMIAFENNRFLIYTGTLVGAFELQHFIMINIAALRTNLDFVAGYPDDFAGMFCQDTVAGVSRHFIFHTGTHNRSLRSQQRYRLTLHVGAHERTVGIIVFQERNQGRCDRYNLLRRYVHIIRPFRRDAQYVVLTAGRNTFAQEITFVIQRFVGLCNDIFIFLVSGQIFNFIGNTFMRLIHFAVRCFNKTKLVNNRKGRKRTDQADVRTFRRLNGAHTSVVGVMYVTDFITGPFTGQTAGSQCRETAFMRQLCQRIVLIHELGQLAAAKEFLNRRHHRTDIDQRLRSDNIHVLDGHAFFYHTFHTGQADTELVLQKFAYAADTTVAQMVDIIFFTMSVHYIQQITKRSKDIFFGNGAEGFRNSGSKDDTQYFPA